MKDKELIIYTLAEAGTFQAVICNYLGWAPICTYGYDFMRKRCINPDAIRLDILEKLKGMNTTIKALHLFKPLSEPDLEYYRRHYIDDAISWIKLLVKSGVKVNWDEIPRDERDLLARHSPPLYDKLFGNRIIIKEDKP